MSGCIDTHLVLVDLRANGIDEARVEILLNARDIVGNKNSCLGNKSDLVPDGFRLGASASTSKPLKKKDFETVLDLFDKGVNIAIRAKKTSW